MLSLLHEALKLPRKKAALMSRRERRTLKSIVGREGRLKPNLAWQVGGLRRIPQHKGWGNKGRKYSFWSIQHLISRINCPSRNQAGVFASGEIRQNIKLAAFWCVFLRKIKVVPESW